MKKYNRRYLIKSAKWCFGLALPVSCLFLIISFFADVVEYDLLVSLVPLFVALIVWAFLACSTIRVNYMFERQTIGLRLCFDDSNVRKISRSSTIYLTDDWLIASGRLVLHRNYINSISVRNENKYNSNGGYYVCFDCVNSKRYKLFIPSISEYKEIRKWYNGV